jgi:hypothetical protein
VPSSGTWCAIIGRKGTVLSGKDKGKCRKAFYGETKLTL